VFYAISGVRWQWLINQRGLTGYPLHKAQALTLGLQMMNKEDSESVKRMTLTFNLVYGKQFHAVS
jgi:hypothetical protein